MQTKKSKTALVDMARDWYLGAADHDATTEWRQRANKALRFYEGSGQWESATRELLKSQGKPALTINRILPVVNVIWGQQLKNRSEIRLYPRKRATKAVAELGSALIKHAMSCCEGYDAVSDAYRDGVITGKGWLTVDRVFDHDPISGDVVVQAPNPLLIYEDPRNTAYHIDGGEFVFRERFVTKTQLEAHYPKQAKAALDAMEDDWSKVWAGQAGEGDGYLAAVAKLLDTEGDDVGEGLPGVVVRECWYRTFESVSTASARINGRLVSTRLEDEAQEARLEQFVAEHPGHEIDRARVVVPVLHLLVMVGDVLLKTEDDPLNGMTTFPYIRFSPYWLHGHPFGVVDNLEGPQEEHNKLRSQTLHLLNTAGNPAWKAKRATPHGRHLIDQYGSTPGVLLELDDFGGILERIDPASLSAGHFALAERAQEDIREISGANPDITGTQPEQSESGRARLIRQEAGQTTLGPIVANLRRTEAAFGDMLWEFMRHNDVYSPEEIEAVIDEDTLAAIGGVQGAVAAMNSWDTGTYGVKTAAAPSSTTWRDVQLTEVRDLATFVTAMGLQLPPDVANALLAEVLELSSFPGSAKVADMLKARPAGPAASPGAPGPAGGLPQNALAASP